MKLKYQNVRFKTKNIHLNYKKFIQQNVTLAKTVSPKRIFY